MNEQQIKAIEKALASIKDTKANLRRQIAETEIEIERLESVEATLVQQLPAGKRFDHLFSTYRYDMEGPGS